MTYFIKSKPQLIEKTVIMQRFIITTFLFLVASFSTNAALRSDQITSKVHIGASAENTYDFTSGEVLYLVETQQGFILFSGESAHKPVDLYGFTGRYLDTESDLWYFRARYYSDELGRFISRDPMGYVDGMSLYAGYFASGFALDPKGLRSRQNNDEPTDTVEEEVIVPLGPNGKGPSIIPPDINEDDRKAGCICERPNAFSKFTRPAGIGGVRAAPVGTGVVPCKLGQFVRTQYKAKCIKKKVNEGDKCEPCPKKSCSFYILWECKYTKKPRKGRPTPTTAWIPVDGMKFSKCK